MSTSDDQKKNNGFTRSSASRALDEVIGEAKDHLHAAPEDIDWSRLESRLMAEVEKEKPALLRDIEEAKRVASRRTLSRDNVLRGGVFVLAAAAAIAVFVRRDHANENNAQQTAAATPGMTASSLKSTEGAGEVHIKEVIATPGYAVHQGDTIDTDGARAVFERSRKVAWLIEQDGAVDQAHVKGASAQARAHVKSAGESLVLGLDNGVIEAQVVPVPTGEAFAVDIATDRSLVRVAVHGTHLRVARAGTRVVVDLTEGVVSIGVPPRTGITYGTLVTAPAHVELDANDLTSIKVEHDAQMVRTAIHLGTAETIAAGNNGNVAPQQARPPELLPTPTPQQPPTLMANNGNSKPSSQVTAPQPKPEEQPKKIAAVLPPRDVITAGIRDCAAKTPRKPGLGLTDAENASRHVTVTSTLRLKVNASGTVEQAQFTPPLLPEIQTCAAQVIYRTHLEETGSVTIPVEFAY